MKEKENIRLCDIIGNFGKYQMVLIVLNFLTAWYLGIVRMIMELLAPSVNFYWDWEASNPNKTVFKSTNCKMADVLEHNRTSKESDWSSKLIFESPYSKRTLSEELNMICERSWLVSFASTMLLFGDVIGSLIICRITEIYGRTRCSVWLALLCFISNIIMLFPQGYIMFLVAAIVYGATGPNVGAYIFFQVVEMAPQKWAEYAGIFCKTGQIFGQTILVGVAWLVEDWFYTQVFHTVFSGVALVILLYALESPVWLAVRGRYDEAENTIKTIVLRNGLNAEEAECKTEIFLQQMKRHCEIENSAEKGKFSDLFKNRTITFYTFALSTVCSLVFFLYTGLIVNAETFGSGMYVDLTSSNFLSLTSFLISMALLKTFSMRNQIIFLCFSGGTMCFIYIFFCDVPLAGSVLIILGRCFMTPAANLFFVYDTQITPTSVRAVSGGFRSAVSSIITALCPFTKELGESTGRYAPFILFAACGCISAGLMKMLPEIRGKEPVHTVDELAKKKRDSSKVSIQLQ